MAIDTLRQLYDSTPALHHMGFDEYAQAMGADKMLVQEAPEAPSTTLSGVASAVGRGLVGVPRMGLQAIKGIDEAKDYLLGENAGIPGAPDIKSWAGQQDTGLAGWQERNFPITQQPTDIEQGVESFTTSIGAKAPGALAGAAAGAAIGATFGSAIPGLGTVALGAVGGTIGYLASAPGFGLAQYSQSLDEARKKGLAEHDAQSYAALMGASETGFELATDALDLLIEHGAARAGSVLGKQGIKDAVSDIIKRGLGQSVKAGATIAGVETAGELANAGSQAEISNAYGMGDDRFWGAVTKALGPVGTASVLFGAVGGGLHYVGQSHFHNVLTSPVDSGAQDAQARMAYRQGVADQVTDDIKHVDPQLAKVWSITSRQAIQDNLPLDLTRKLDRNQPFDLLQDSGPNKPSEAALVGPVQSGEQAQEPQGSVAGPALVFGDAQALLGMEPSEDQFSKAPKPKTWDETLADFRHGVSMDFDRAAANMRQSYQQESADRERTKARETFDQQVSALAGTPALPAGQGFELVPEGQRRDLPVPSTAIPMDYTLEAKNYREIGPGTTATTDQSALPPSSSSALRGLPSGQGFDLVGPDDVRPGYREQAAADFDARAKELMSNAIPAGQGFDMVPDAMRKDRLPVRAGIPMGPSMDFDSMARAQRIDTAAHEAATSPLNDRPEPTQAQKEAGNYKKGQVRIQGLDISIENPKGSMRSGTDAQGKPWQTTMENHYGYIRGTRGRDKDHIDVFLGKDPESAKTVYVVDQVNPETGKFDEHKVMLGYANKVEAKAAYLDNYQQGWKGLGAMTAMPVEDFKAWLKSDKTTKPLAPKLLEPKAKKISAEVPEAQRASMGNGDGPLFALEKANDKTPLGFYSALARKIVDKLPGSGTGEQQAKTIESWAKKGEFKTEELEWSGLKEWLESKGGEKVSKSEVADFLRQGGVKVEEVQKGSTSKFREHKLPGGKNYREVLLTLPDAGKTPTGDHNIMVNGEEWSTRVDPSNLERELAVARRENPDATVEAVRAFDESTAPPSFKSRHWDEPNVIAHLRLQDFTDAAGKRVLLVDEIQSDWHQEGRKNGYAETPQEAASRRYSASNILAGIAYDGHTEFDISHMSNEERSKTRRLADMVEAGVATPEESKDWEAMKNGLQPLSSEQSEEAKKARDEWRTIRKGGPDAPFKTSWPLLAFRRALSMAVEGGYDKIAWTPGEAQAERYNLSKQISKIVYSQTSGGIGPATWSDELPGLLRATDRNGREVINQHIPPDRLPDYVGKEVSDKLLAQDPKSYNDGSGMGAVAKSLSGIDLKVGGDGMKAFYDKMLPNEVNKYVKKWGGKVEQDELKTGQVVHSLDISDAMRRDISDKGQPLFRGATESRGMSVDAARTILDRFQSSAVNASPLEVVQSIGDLPADVLKSAAGRNVSAAFDPKTNRTYIIADRSTPESLVRHWLHEQGLHNGLRGIFKDQTQLDRVRDFVYRAMPDSAVRDIAEQYVLSPENVAHQRIMAEEYLAGLAEKVHLGEDLTPQERPAWKRVFEAVKSFVRRLVGKGGELTDSDIDSIVKDAIRWTLNGNPTGDGAAAVERVDNAQWAAVDKALAAGKMREQAMFSAEKSQANFEQQVDDMKVGKLNPRRQLEVLVSTPEVYKALGKTDLPVVMPQAKAWKVLGKHDLTVDQLKALPREIADPVMVFRSTSEANSLIALTGIKNKDGAPIIAAIHFDVKTREATIHEVASAYGKDGYSSWINRQAMEGTIAFVNKKKTSAWSRAMSGLQLPGGAANIRNASGRKILTEKDVVNYLSEEGIGKPLFKLEPSKIADLASRDELPEIASSLGIKDLGKWAGLNLPYWQGKKHAGMKRVVDVELNRRDQRSAMEASMVRKADKFFGLKGRDMEEARALILDLDGNKQAAEEVGASPFRAVKDDSGRAMRENGRTLMEINPEFEPGLRKYLDGRGVSEKVADAYVGLQEAFNTSWLKSYDMMRGMGDFVSSTDIEDYRNSLGKIPFYFPHVWYGDFVLAGKDAQGNTVVRKSFDVSRLYPSGSGLEQGQAEKIAKRMQGELAAEYPEAVTWKLDRAQGLPEETYRHKIDVSALQQIVDSAAKRLASGDMANKEAAEAIRTHLSQGVAETLQSRGFARHHIGRKGTPGFESQDVQRVAMEHFTGLSGWSTKIAAAKDFTAALAGIDATKTPGTWTQAAKYVQAMLANADRTDQTVGMLKSVFFHTYLGANIKTAMVNLTQNVIAGWPRLSMDVGMSGPRLMKAAADSVMANLTKGRNLAADESRLLSELLDEHEITANYLAEVRGRISKYGSIPQRILDGVGWPMAVAERFNRASLALAAYRAARDGKIDNLRTLKELGLEKGQKAPYEVAKDFATGLVRDSHFVLGKANSPLIFQDSSTGKMLSSAYTFRSFSHNIMSLWKWMLLDNGWRGRAAFAKSMLGSMAVGGLAALPFFNSLVRVIQSALKTDDEPEDWIKKHLTSDPDVNDAIRYGLPSLLGVNVGNSLGIEAPLSDKKPTTKLEDALLQEVKDLIGIPWDMAVSRPVRTIEALQSGDKGRAIEALAPSAVTNVLKARRLATEGQTTMAGKPINLPGHEKEGPRRLETWEAILQGLGFQPLSSAKSWDVYKRLEYSKSLRQEVLGEFANRLAKARSSGDDAAIAAVREDMAAWNARARDDSKGYLVITGSSLRQSTRNRLKPSRQPRQMRSRAAGLVEEYDAE